jgi:hypothetical protein
MSARLLALRTGRALLPRSIIFLHLYRHTLSILLRLGRKGVYYNSQTSLPLVSVPMSCFSFFVPYSDTVSPFTSSPHVFTFPLLLAQNPPAALEPGRAPTFHVNLLLPLSGPAAGHLLHVCIYYNAIPVTSRGDL